MDEELRSEVKLDIRRLKIGIGIFIVPLIIGLMSFFIIDTNYVVGHDTVAILLPLCAATFGILVVFYTLTQTDKTRNNEFMALCTIAVGILFILSMTTGVVILINESYLFLLEIRCSSPCRRFCRPSSS